MADSHPARRDGKRERLIAGATEVLHHQGVERTTLADIAAAAHVPVGNVYYYFKTKDELVESALDGHATGLRELTARLDELPAPADRLKALIDGWIGQADVAARYGCPFGTLASELDKRDDGLQQHAASVVTLLIDWAAEQFRQMGHTADARDLAVSLVGAYQGMSLLANTLRDPQVMTDQGRRLGEWVDSVAAA
jgi:TetR/AcrR family transcriptional regulator, transcriptional repressor for nem operon